MATKKVLLASLTFDYTVFPRGQVDSQNVAYIREAIRAGTKLPPLVVCKKTRRVVDGFHRGKAYRLECGEGVKVEIIEKTYKGDKDFFIDACALNGAHGRALSTFDRSHIVVTAKTLGIDLSSIATALNMTTDKLSSLSVDRSAQVNGDSVRTIPIKRTIRHMRGKVLTRPQVEANRKLSGMNQVFYVNQLITLVESRLLNKEDDLLIERLRVLHGLLDDVLVA